MNRSRRKAREGAVRALYEIEVGHTRVHEAIEATVAEQELTPDLAAYTERVVRGVRDNLAELDATISRYLVGYDFTRLAAIDRNILRLGVYEIYYVPEMPPAVTINEAIEIAKRYSTFESGKFVNGVLGKLLLDSPKANWDPALAPPEFAESGAGPAEKIEIEEIDVAPDDPNFKAASRVGGWKLRSE